MRDLTSEFVKYAKEQFGFDIVFEDSDSIDTFEKIFGASFIEQIENEYFFSEGNNYIFYNNASVTINKSDAMYSDDYTDRGTEIALAA